MSSERADQPAAQEGAADTFRSHGANAHPGQALAVQREAMGWSVEQVADQLKLAVRQVVALEAGDYAALPSPAVTRGFVRAYAKLLKMDPAPLVAQIAMETAPTVDASAHATRRAAPASFSESRFPSHGKRSKLPLGLIAVALVVVAGAAAWHAGLMPLPGQHAEPAATTTTTTTPVAPPASAGASAETAAGSSTETLQNPAVPLISVPGASAEANGAATAPVAPTTAGAAPAPAQPAAPAAVAPALNATPAATPAAPTVTEAAGPASTVQAAPAGPNALVLDVREDSWVEVRPAKGGPALIARLVKGGSTETVNVDAPVRMVVGNPAGVTATLRGAPVALPQVPGKTIARVNLQ
jgi:cytoskeleton protein RodZ